MKMLKVIIAVLSCLTLVSCGTNIADEAISEENAGTMIEDVLDEDSDMETKESETEDETSKDRLGGLIDNFLIEEQLNGLALVYSGGETILSKAYGYADIETDVMNTTETAIVLGPQTMQFTAVCIMMLEEQGLLSLEDTLDKYVEDYPNGDEITIHQLLTHTSGINDLQLYIEYTNKDFIGRYHSPLEVIELFRKKPLLYQPGERFSFSLSNYALLGYVIEITSGIPYEEFVETRILSPLSMENTGFYYLDEYPHQAVEHGSDFSVKDGSLKLYPLPALNNSLYYSAAGLSTTADDLLKWHTALSSHTLISDESTRKMHAQSVEVDTSVDSIAFTWYVPSTHYGYGWFIEQSGENPIVSHGSSIEGFCSYIYRDTANDCFIAILCNMSDGYPDMRSGILKILDENE